MHKPETTRPKSARRPVRAECCEDTGCESGARNHYFLGKRLTPDAFRLEQRYLNERRHLVNRAIHGWGVVYGYGIAAMPPAKYDREPRTGRLRVEPGFALDEAGRELVQVGTVDLAAQSVIALDEDGSRIAWDDVAARGSGCWMLRVHYAEQDRNPQTLRDPCSCERNEWDQVCETVRYTLQEVDCEQCCKDQPCELLCDCTTGPCCEEHGKPIDTRRVAGKDAYGEIHERPKHQPGCPPMKRGGCQCLCEHLTKLDPGTNCEALCEIKEDCGRVRVDLRHGVPLACVRLRRDDCAWIFDDWLEACGPRRLVKRNDLLFDLIRGCDLTHISAIGWADWHRSRELVSWAEFEGSFGKREGEVNVTTAYKIEFSRPVRADTVRPDCFAMTVLFPEREGGWREALQVPIVGVYTTADSGVPAGMVTSASLVVDALWVDDALKDYSRFAGVESEVQIDVYGDYITDCIGQQLDANANGLCPAPSGNGSPGGTFHSSFRVAARERTKPSPKPPYEQGAKS